MTKWYKIIGKFKGDTQIRDLNTLGTTGGDFEDKTFMSLRAFAIKYKEKIKNEDIPYEYKKYLASLEKEFDNMLRELDKEVAEGVTEQRLREIEKLQKDIIQEKETFKKEPEQRKIEIDEKGGAYKKYLEDRQTAINSEKEREKNKTEKSKKKKKNIILITLSITLTALAVNYGTPLIMEKYLEYKKNGIDKENREITTGVWKGYEGTRWYKYKIEEVFYVFLPGEDNYWNGYYEERGEKTKKLHWDINNNEITIDIHLKGKEKFNILYITEKEMVLKHYTDEIKVLFKSAERNLNEK